MGLAPDESAAIEVAGKEGIACLLLPVCRSAPGRAGGIKPLSSVPVKGNVAEKLEEVSCLTCGSSHVAGTVEGSDGDARPVVSVHWIHTAFCLVLGVATGSVSIDQSEASADLVEKVIGAGADGEDPAKASWSSAM